MALIVAIVQSYRSIISCYFYRKETNYERVDTDGFQSSSLMTTWKEVFLMPWVEENDKTLLNGYAGV